MYGIYIKELAGVSVTMCVYILTKQIGHLTVY